MGYSNEEIINFNLAFGKYTVDIDALPKDFISFEGVLSKLDTDMLEALKQMGRPTKLPREEIIYDDE